jgi:hypothetical protein
VRRTVLLAFVLAGCKDRGTIDFVVEDSVACSIAAAAEVRVFLVPDTSCGDLCTIPTCGPGCIAVCPDDGAPCATDQPLEFDPPAGAFAAHVRYYTADGELISAACEQVAFAQDGTADDTITLGLTCCAP